MSREYLTEPCRLHELQPPRRFLPPAPATATAAAAAPAAAGYRHHAALHGSSSGAGSPYELSAELDVADAGPPPPPLGPMMPIAPMVQLSPMARMAPLIRLTPPSQIHSPVAPVAQITSLLMPTSNLIQRKRKIHHLSECSSADSTYRPTGSSAGRASLSPQWRRRSIGSGGGGSTCDDDVAEDGRSMRFLPDKKQNHSEIEKRRRDKMNTYITELSGMVPLCGAMARKLDKLTVLRLAVQHLREVRGSLAAPLAARPSHALLRPRDYNALLLRAAHDAFVLVVGCDRGRLLYASASVQHVLHYEQSELLGQSLFDLLHPKDVAKVKEQLSSSDLSPRERLIDAKTMLPVKAELVAGASRFCPGVRRSFFCRVKYRGDRDGTRSVASVKDEEHGLRKSRPSDRKYCVVQCTGYLKSWSPLELGEAPGRADADEADGGAVTCLVGVYRPLGAQPSPGAPLRRIQFTSRFAPDGKFLFVDQRVTLALGFLPQELVGSSLYEWVSDTALATIARAHKAALHRRAPLHSPPYAVRCKDGRLATLSTHFKPVRNPWTKDVECLVANNTLMDEAEPPSDETYELFKQADAEISRLIESQVEARKIGAAIAADAARGGSPAPSPDLLHDVVFGQNNLADTLLATPARESPAPEPEPAPLPSPSPPPPLAGLDGNGEATMAVIMSLLEADAGLGGSVNFSGLPWPLP